LDHDGYLPTYAYISNGKRPDVSVARKVLFAPGSIVIMDRGYNDYKLFARWTENQIYFVTRLKDNADYIVIAEKELPQNRNVLADQFILFAGYQAQKNCPQVLRRIVVWDKENKKEIVLLTNHFDFGATTIAAVYKDRWQIELFFKALKQNLKVKTFVGTTENALYIQIWTALIAMLLIKYLQFKSKLGWSLSNLVAFLRWNLFTYRNLWEWIDSPFDTLPIVPKSVQYPIPFRGFGQHLSLRTT
jgi:IS4 transposase